MTKKKWIVANFSDVASNMREQNTEKCYMKNIPYDRICGCCGKEIKDPSKVHELHLIDGSGYFTEDVEDDADGYDMGWWTVGNVCYRKFKKALHEVELVRK